MQKLTFKHKKVVNKRAFTLIELLIVIAIIGILFIVLVSKVDFATDKAKATGVQTDFRSFQVAFETVSKENAGFNTFGWDTGDANQDGIRNSYDEGDNGAGGGIAHNGIQDGTEVFTGHKVYAETFTKVYSLKKNGTGSYDRNALNRLETAINANLDPKLHITIKDDGEIVMANGAQDPWNKEYHGWYITNAETDKKDRGAIVMYSDGANNEFGSEHSIANGVVTVNVPGNNKLGKDDYSISVVYTFANGYGEVQTSTSGFSNNQTTQGNTSNNYGTEGKESTKEPDVTELLEPGLYNAGAIELAKTGGVEAAQDMLKTSWNDLLSAGIVHVTNGVVYGNFDLDAWENASSDALDGDLVLPNDGSITAIGDAVWDEDSEDYIGNVAFQNCYNLTGIAIPKGVTSITNGAFGYCDSLTSITIPDSVTSIGNNAFDSCKNLTRIVIPDSVTSIGDCAFAACMSLTSVVIGDGVTSIGYEAFWACNSLTSITIPDSVTSIGEGAFRECYTLVEVINKSNLDIVAGSYGHGYEYVGYYAIEVHKGDSKIANKDNYLFYTYNGVNYLLGYIGNDTELTLPDSYNGENYEIYNNAFLLRNDLSSVVIPDSVTEIGEGAFCDCDSLTSVTIGNNVTSIGRGAFYDCDILTNITFNGSVEQWSSISKDADWKYRVPATYVQCTDGQVTF